MRNLYWSFQNRIGTSHSSDIYDAESLETLMGSRVPKASWALRTLKHIGFRSLKVLDPGHRGTLLKLLLKTSPKMVPRSPGLLMGPRGYPQHTEPPLYS